MKSRINLKIFILVAASTFFFIGNSTFAGGRSEFINQLMERYIGIGSRHSFKSIHFKNKHVGDLCEVRLKSPIEIPVQGRQLLTIHNIQFLFTKSSNVDQKLEIWVPLQLEVVKLSPTSIKKYVIEKFKLAVDKTYKNMDQDLPGLLINEDRELSEMIKVRNQDFVGIPIGKVDPDSISAADLERFLDAVLEEFENSQKSWINSILKLD